jgi:hypothetical protein
MTVVTLKGLPPTAAVKVFEGTKARPYVERRELCPYTPFATGAASAIGNVSFDLPDGIEYLAQLPDGTARWVLNATTPLVSP